MKIRFEDFREETQLEIWEEVRSYLLWSERIEPQRPDESLFEYTRRVHDAVEEFISKHNHCITFDICRTTN